METPFDESNEKIAKFLKENNLFPMHLEMYLTLKCEVICRAKWEDDALSEELDKLREQNDY